MHFWFSCQRITADEPFHLCSPDNQVHPGNAQTRACRASEIQMSMRHRFHLHSGEGQKGSGVMCLPQRDTNNAEPGGIPLGRVTKALSGLTAVCWLFFSNRYLSAALCNTEVTDRTYKLDQTLRCILFLCFKEWYSWYLLKCDFVFNI